ncbi:MAG: glycosyltransferase family 4 protein [Candidatus Bathyarchaeia archaeon]
MKIAMIVERFPPDIGGSGVRFYKIAERLAQRHEIDVLTLGHNHIQFVKRNFRVYRFNSDKLPFLPYYGLNRIIGHSFSTFFQLLFRSYDVIDIDIWPIIPFFSAKIAKPFAPAIVSWNVAWPFSFNKAVSKISNTLAHIVSKLSTHNITVSNFAKTILINQLNINPKKIDVIPNGVDETFFKAKLEPQQGRIVFVGRLEHQKRLDLLLEAFKILKKKVSDAELHIIGSGPLYSRLLQASRKINGICLHNSISADKKDEIISQLSKSWVFVSASEFETYGLAIAESLCVGLPVVVTQTPYNAAISELVKHAYNGLIVEHNSPTAIAAALEELYKNQRLWVKLSQNAKLSSFCSWDDVAKKIEDIYICVKNQN